MKIFTSSQHLQPYINHGAFGNHMLHLYAIYSLSKKLNIPFRISCDSNLDVMFELEEYKEYNQPTVLFREEYGGDIDEYHKKELNNYSWTSNIKENIKTDQDFQLQGWFWNSSLLPDPDIFDVIKIRKSLIDQIAERQYLKEEGTLVLHYRGKDFKYHTVGWGDLSLKQEYYDKCIESYKTNNILKKLIIISDEPEYVANFIKTDAEIIIERNNEFIDWLILLFCKNLICSNSSFCYTAGWFNKNLVYQPEKFFTRYKNTEKHFPPNPYYENAIIM